MDEFPLVPSNDPPADTLAASAQVREKVEQLVASLPERYRLPVLLHYFHGMTHREIAATLGQPVSTVSNRIASAHRRLEPRMRRAGLGGALALLCAIRVHGGMLLDPPAALGAAQMFAAAGAKAAASASLAGGAAELARQALARLVDLAAVKAIKTSLLVMIAAAGLLLTAGLLPEAARAVAKGTHAAVDAIHANADLRGGAGAAEPVEVHEEACH